MIHLILPLLLLIAAPLSANEVGFGVKAPVAYPSPPPVSRAGKVTGGGCNDDIDCMPGCLNNSDDVVCVSQIEASDRCVSPDGPLKIDHLCACLPDVKRCGYAYPKAVPEQIAPPVMQKTQPMQPKKSPPKKKLKKKKKIKPSTPKTEAHP